MLRILQKLDIIIIVVVITIFVGIVVVNMRSKTYAIGYEIAKLKFEEKNLREQSAELKSELAAVQRSTRERLLAERQENGTPKYVLPDISHVLSEE